MSSKQVFFESDDSYRDRIAREADEQTIRDATGSSPSQGFFESNEDYRDRLAREADEAVIEEKDGSARSQGFFESDDAYDNRISQEADERTVADLTGDAPSQGFFESDENYRNRVEVEADEAVIENATGSAPSQGFFESDESYRDRISEEAYEHRSDDGGISGGCFITSACVEFAGLRDDCHELTVLRHFRDHYLANISGGRKMIDEYYKVAPKILANIAKIPDRQRVMCDTWSMAGENATALAIYSLMFENLRATFDGQE